MTWEYEQVIEMAEQAEIAANVELEQLGFITNPVEYERDVYGEECEAFWAFACDLHDEPRGLVLYELY